MTTGLLIAIYNESLAKKFNIRKHFSTEDYFYNVVLQRGTSTGVDSLGPIQLNLSLTLMLMCILIFACSIHDIKSSRKILFLSVVYPYLITIIFFIETTSTSKISKTGFLAYLAPDFSKLSRIDMWRDAVDQIFFTLGVVEGGLMTFASYNRLYNDVVFDAFLFASVDTVTSIIIAITIFGHMSHVNAFSQSGASKSHIEEIPMEGFNFAFIIFLKAISSSSSPKTWASLYFLLMITLGVGSQIGYIENIKCVAMDFFKIGLQFRIALLSQIFVVLFILGLVMSTPGSIYLFFLINEHIYAWVAIILALLTILSLTLYGSRRFCKIIEIMVGTKVLRCVLWKYLQWYFIICWQIITPLSLIFISLTSLIFRDSEKKSVLFPPWVLGFGIAFTMLLLHATVSVMVFDIWKTPGNWKQKIITLLIPGSAYLIPKALHSAQRRNTIEDFNTTSEIGRQSQSSCGTCETGTSDSLLHGHEKSSESHGQLYTPSSTTYKTGIDTLSTAASTPYTCTSLKEATLENELRSALKKLNENQKAGKESESHPKLNEEAIKSRRISSEWDKQTAKSKRSSRKSSLHERMGSLHWRGSKKLSCTPPSLVEEENQEEDTDLKKKRAAGKRLSQALRVKRMQEQLMKGVSLMKRNSTVEAQKNETSEQSRRRSAFADGAQSINQSKTNTNRKSVKRLSTRPPLRLSRTASQRVKIPWTIDKTPLEGAKRTSKKEKKPKPKKDPTKKEDQQ